MSPADALRDWHDFAVTIAAAAATLIGAMFVVMSIGSGFLTRERAHAVRAFLTPTVIHLASALLGAALTMVPTLDWPVFAALVGAGGLIGFGYSATVLVRVHGHPVDWVDRIWYGGLPLLGYAAAIAAAWFLLARAVAGIDLLAGVLALLLVAGIRNAWDMLVFIVAQARGSG